MNMHIQVHILYVLLRFYKLPLIHAENFLFFQEDDGYPS